MTISAFLARFGFLCEKSEVLFTNVYSSSPVSHALAAFAHAVQRDDRDECTTCPAAGTE
jgi:hypothetical protein